MVSFPAPVGGTVYPIDFAPSILFATLYGLLIPLMLYRMLQRRGRSTLLISTMAFSIERRVFMFLLSYGLFFNMSDMQNCHLLLTGCTGTLGAETVFRGAYQVHANFIWAGLYWHFERPCRSLEVPVSECHIWVGQIRRVSCSV